MICIKKRKVTKFGILTDVYDILIETIILTVRKKTLCCFQNKYIYKAWFYFMHNTVLKFLQMALPSPDSKCNVYHTLISINIESHNINLAGCEQWLLNRKSKHQNCRQACNTNPRSNNLDNLKGLDRFTSLSLPTS